MSYILEALKKAQAERQLGNAPTLHATQPVPAAEPGAAASRKPLFIGLGAGALVVAAGALLVWQRVPAPAAVPVATPPATGIAPPAMRTPAAAPLAAAAASTTLEVSAPPAPAPASRPAHAAHVPADVPAAAPVPAAVSPRRAMTPAPAPSADDGLPFLQQLPDAIQRDVPRVAFGGYMYSANPADRLLLVDKALRHEGEEVAPGLVLEKLLPKAAVMNYRGVRYRVAY
jgi:general secretion pathway protein B